MKSIPHFIGSGRLLWLLPVLLGGMAAKAAFSQPIKTKLKNVLVLEHGTGPGHRASSDHFNEGLRDMGLTHGFTVKVLAQNANLVAEFSPDSLAKYQVVILNNNDGVHRFITGTARKNFEAFVENGGGLLVSHAASAFIDGWPWIDSVLVQKFYGPHQTAGPSADLHHDAEGLIPDTETRGIAKDLTAPKGFIDSFYQFKASPRGQPGVTILLTVDESSSNINFQSPMVGDHPVAWAKTVVKGRVVHTCLGHSFAERGHNAYTQKDNYLNKFIFTSIRYAAGDFLGCMDDRYAEYSPDATKSDPTQCLTQMPTRLALNAVKSRNGMPMVFQDRTRSLLQVDFFSSGHNALTISDINGKSVYQKVGSGQVRYIVPIPKKRGIYLVKAVAEGMITTHRVTVL